MPDQPGKKKQPTFKEWQSSQRLRCELTPQELQEATDALVRGHDQIHELEDEKKSVMDEIKSRIAACEAEVTRNNNLVRNKNTFREVKIMCRKDFKTGQYTAIRLDTGEVFKERPLMEDERQMEIKD